jgi:nucleoside phosphorylase
VATALSKPVLVTFARPEESRAFRRGLADPRREKVGAISVLRGWLGQTETVVAHLGIGPAAAAESFEVLLDAGPWRLVYGAGFAGGLDPALALGDVVMEELFPGQVPRIISRPLPVETIPDKARLRAETGAQAVDMETETLRDACRIDGLPVLAIRAISDPATTALPVPFAKWFDLARQRPRPLALLGYLLRHPRAIAPFARFVGSLGGVTRALAFAVESAICGLEHH